MAYYLTYRPQKIADLDLPEIRQGLINVLAKKSPPHAYLFTGPRGAGKTSAARILAKSFNCLQNKGHGEPCGRCASCEEIARGSFIDLIEIDGASNRGIDDVRSLKENIRLVPAKGRAKVYIIDEVHMLTTEAFNALLKTLEEPPPHVYFVLCTTEPEKVPETIVSRCVQFNFRKAKPAEVVLSLQKVVAGEKIQVEPEALALLARSVDGSFRDAQKILDQLSALKKIGITEVRAALGQGSGFSGRGLLAILAAGTVGEALTKLEKMTEEGVNFRQFSREVLEALRALLLVKVGVADRQEEAPPLNLDVSEVKQLLRLFSLAAREVKGSLIEQLPLEMAVVEWFQSRGQLQQGPGGRAEEMKKDQEPVRTKPMPGSASGKDQPPSGKKIIKVKIKTGAPAAVASPEFPGNGHGQLVLASVIERWNDLLTEVKPMNHSVSALLRACRPQQVEGDVLVLEVFYPFHKERLETTKCRELVEAAAGSIFGFPVKIKCILGRKEAVDSVSAVTVEDELVAEAEKIFTGPDKATAFGDNKN